VIAIDGSKGEGGGQILRTALGLAIVTGQPFRIERIRAGRSKPGLLRQHLTAVRAAEAVGDAVVEGGTLGSQTVTFTPRAIRGGTHRFAVGSAGSATLVLQTILPALLRATEPSDIEIEGGTHNSSSPPFPFLADAFAPLLGRMGARVDLELVAFGFYPAGSGKLRATIAPCTQLARLELLERGAIAQRRVRVLLSRVPEHVATRELATLRAELGWPDDAGVDARTESVQSAGPGNVLVVTVASENVTEVFTGFGERGTRAEDVARRVSREVKDYLGAGVPVGEHLADQLVLPMALGDGGMFRTVVPSKHLLTQIDVVRTFTGRETRITDEGGGVHRVAVA
jgi:RNA 3'-terminal phosphate cyclase (ATP)